MPNSLLCRTQNTQNIPELISILKNTEIIYIFNGYRQCRRPPPRGAKALWAPAADYVYIYIVFRVDKTMVDKWPRTQWDTNSMCDYHQRQCVRRM